MPERGFILLEVVLIIFLIGLVNSGVVQTFMTSSGLSAKKVTQDFLTCFVQFKGKTVIRGQTPDVLIDASSY